jgi:hypothetical protein
MRYFKNLITRIINVKRLVSYFDESNNVWSFMMHPNINAIANRMEMKYKIEYFYSFYPQRNRQVKIQINFFITYIGAKMGDQVLNN